MFRWMRVLSLFVLLFSLGSPAMTQAAPIQASTAQRLVIFEGFYAPS